MKDKASPQRDRVMGFVIWSSLVLQHLSGLLMDGLGCLGWRIDVYVWQCSTNKYLTMFPLLEKLSLMSRVKTVQCSSLPFVICFSEYSWWEERGRKFPFESLWRFFHRNYIHLEESRCLIMFAIYFLNAPFYPLGELIIHFIESNIAMLWNRCKIVMNFKVICKTSKNCTPT